MYQVGTLRTSRDYTVTVPANSGVDLNVTGNFYSVISTTAATLRVGLNDGGLAVAKKATKRYVPAGEEFQVVRIENVTAAPMTVVMEIGYGDYLDGEIQIGGQVVVGGGDTLADQADVTVAATTTAQVLAANTARTEAWISNLSGAVTLRWGTSAAAAARGIPVAPGATVIISSSAAIYVYNPSASGVDVARLEIEN